MALSATFWYVGGSVWKKMGTSKGTSPSVRILCDRVHQAVAKADLGIWEGRLFLRLVEPMGSRTGEGRRAVSEEEGDAREPGSPLPRRNSRSLGWAAPLSNVLRSLGYPATNSPRGKAQAGDSPRRHQEKNSNRQDPCVVEPKFFANDRLWFTES